MTDLKAELDRLRAKLRQVYRYNLRRDYPLLKSATKAEMDDHVEALMMEEPVAPTEMQIIELIADRIYGEEPETSYEMALSRAAEILASENKTGPEMATKSPE